MNSRENILKILWQTDVKKRFTSVWIYHLYLFWSAARDEINDNSDLDLLYELEENSKTTLWDLVELENFLLQKIKVKKIDFVSKKKLNSKLIPYVKKDLIQIF